MKSTRPANTAKQLASANRIRLDEDTKALMASRKVNVDGLIESRLNSTFIFGANEVILHVTGNAQERAVFIEYHNRSFEIYAIDALQDTENDLPLEEMEGPFHQESLTLATAKTRFSAMGYYYFGYCIPKSNVLLITKSITKDDFISFNDANATIESAISAGIFSSSQLVNLFLFDQDKAIVIDTKKTKYDFWLDEWNKKLTKDFNLATNENARKVLQLLLSYLSGGKAKRFFFGKWHHHYCEEIEELLSNYIRRERLENTRPIIEKANAFNRSESFSEVGELLANPIELIPLHTDSINASVENILHSLKVKIDHSKLPNLKAHGDLYALLQVIKDYTDVDYFALPYNIDPSLTLNSPRF